MNIKPESYYVVCVSVPDQLSGEQGGGQESVTIQQGGQGVYPAHVQYVDGSDPGIYASTNGQMYDSMT